MVSRLRADTRVGISVSICERSLSRLYGIQQFRSFPYSAQGASLDAPLKDGYTDPPLH